MIHNGDAFDDPFDDDDHGFIPDDAPSRPPNPVHPDRAAVLKAQDVLADGQEVLDVVDQAGVDLRDAEQSGDELRIEVAGDRFCEAVEEWKVWRAEHYEEIEAAEEIAIRWRDDLVACMEMEQSPSLQKMRDLIACQEMES